MENLNANHGEGTGGNSMLFELFKSVIDQDGAPVVICDLDLVIVYMNPASVRMYRGDLTGKSLRQCHNQHSNARIDAVIEYFSKSTDNNVVYTSRDDRENKDIYMVALRNSDGVLIGFYEKHEYRNKESKRLYDI